MTVAAIISGLLLFAWSQVQPAPYDKSAWDIANQTAAALPCCSQPATILLLKSRHATGGSGAEEPLSSVDLLILEGQRVRYSFTMASALDKSSSPFFMDDVLEVRDVTGDGVSEVVFHSGTRGASDSHVPVHIIHYDKTKSTFRDIAIEPFYNSGRHAVRWLGAGHRIFAIIADENNKPSTPLDERCHYCPVPFLYTVYVWNSRDHVFVINRRIDGKATYTTAHYALDVDWPLIQATVGH